MMSPREEAAELYTKFQQYYWDETEGFMPDHDQTIKTVNLVIDEIETQAENWGVNSVKAYWIQVRNELKTIQPMKTHLAPTELLTVVIDGAEITVTAQQLLQLKQAETTDPDKKYRELLEQLKPKWLMSETGGNCELVEFDIKEPELVVKSQLSAQRVRAYIKMLNIAAKLNGEADWNNEDDDDAYGLLVIDGEIKSVGYSLNSKDECIKFKTKELALEALTYLNSEDKIAMFGCDKVKEY
jgi:hypothetical protein